MNSYLLKIAIYYDLPAGGASRTMEEEVRLLNRSHQIEIFHNISSRIHPPFLRRLFADLESTFFQKFIQRQQANTIDRMKFDLVYVSHDQHSQAPWVLRFLKTPTVFLCQEPTRAYFEEFLKIDSKLPLLNKLYESLNRYLRKKIEIKNASFAKRVVANSIYSTESIFKAYGLLSSPIYLGIDKSEYFPEVKIKKNQVLVVGNNEPQKALPFAIEVVSKISANRRPGIVIACPRDRDYSEIKKLAKKQRVKVDFVVGLSQNELRRVYSQSRITLAVAYLEPFGLSVIESLACGTPVVAVREGGFKETVTHQKTGLLIERDAAKMARAIETLLATPDKLSSMGKAGVVDVNKRFTWEKTVDQLEKIFYETCRH